MVPAGGSGARSSPRTGSASTDCVDRRRRRSVGCGQRERHGGADALASLAIWIVPSIDSISCLQNRESQPRALNRRPICTESVEGGEDPWQIVAGDPDPAVADDDAHMCCDALGDDRDRAAEAVVLDGVGEQVHQHLLERPRLGHHPQRPGRRAGQAHAGRVRHRRDERSGRRPRSRAASTPRRRRRKSSRSMRAQVEHVVDELEQVVARALRALEPAPLVGRKQVLAIHGHELSEAEDAR